DRAGMEVGQAPASPLDDTRPPGGFDGPGHGRLDVPGDPGEHPRRASPRLGQVGAAGPAGGPGRPGARRTCRARRGGPRGEPAARPRPGARPDGRGRPRPALMLHALRTAPDGATDLRRAIRANIVAWDRRLTRLRHLIPCDSAVHWVAIRPDGAMIA